MQIQTFDSVWDAIGDTVEQAENMKIRAQLMRVLTDFIVRKELSQAEAARTLGITQPRVSELVHGKIHLFSIDKLISMMATAGIHIANIEVTEGVVA
ncbi:MULTISPECIES: helix-turn-helix domain-containing protein [Brenneria]|uniref:Transcriptional regulator n=1 Tax=Brenneria nigrifluens DSM 30175 = ATCC 13028 TaxID=1121120 RepID=A0A2U1UX65_9GAMM|nr:MULTISPECIES: XRE family transcriptional regulator [Brenneria]PWC26265.1 transcriptional regulator [Brenneria nigrifluens DSM 30175 = ATCC 13028]QCR06970.1 XRE family transcriptional regulator [Brenneria nigrifluens DSM 30175 = ATCC 13028]